jgi:hypothetical protein
LVGVEVNHDHCPPLHAHNGNEKKMVHKKKVLETIVRKNVEKVTLILFIHVVQPTLENSGAWVVWSQHRVNVTHQMKYPFAQYACCTCVWAL